MSRHSEPIFTPALADWPNAGVYQLEVRLTRTVRLTVGSLGRLHLEAGVYVYTGRAARGLRARVLRHVRDGRCRHWHIDYLLASRSAHVERVLLASTNPDDECLVSARTGRSAVRSVPHFGSSDCRAGCPTHLWRTE